MFDSALHSNNENNESHELVVDEDESSSSSDDNNSDDSSLPYQYLIEKDIERENSKNAKKRSKQKNTDSDVAVITNDVVEETFADSNKSNNNSNHSQSSWKSNSKIRSRQDFKDYESLPTDVINLRSSDITDLVMKGLMFTIRQDKDTVTVVEQKTKLEVDEVLENSEKVENKEGDQCLLNSSLLRLEKMITRMQEPASLPEQRQNGMPENALVSFIDSTDEMQKKSDEKFNEADIAESEKMCGNLETANGWSNFFTDKDFSDPNFDNLEKTSIDEANDFYDNISNEDEDLVLRMDSSEEEEEEDIIPEALLSTKFLSKNLEDLRKKSTSVKIFENSSMKNKDFLDKESKSQKISEKSSNSNESYNSLKLNGSSNKIKDLSKNLRILSNQLITNAQIPPALLKSLKKSSSQQQHESNEKSSSGTVDDCSVNNNNNKINKESIDKIESSSNCTKKNSIKYSELDNIKNTESIVENQEDSKINCSEKSETKSDFIDKTISDSPSDELNDQNISKRITRSNSNNVSNGNSLNSRSRRTRSNSKLSENNLDLESVKSTLKNELPTKNRSQKTFKQETSEVLNYAVIKKKRRNSTQDQSTTKFFKIDDWRELENEDVLIDVSKLLHDLTYGVKIVIERLDVKSISS